MTRVRIAYICPDHGSVQAEIAAQTITSLKLIISEQDPDVLDTWFSSGPVAAQHARAGRNRRPTWPAGTRPTVLMTGRDIITLWVARMVMMGMYNMGGPARSPSPGTPGDGPG